MSIEDVLLKQLRDKAEEMDITLQELKSMINEKEISYIKKCPFCGCEPHDIKDNRVYHPYRGDCLLSGIVFSLKLWNRRVQ